MSLSKNLIISLLNNSFVNKIKDIPSVKRFAFNYVGAESIDEFVEKLQHIIDNGYRVTISFLGEHYSSKDKVEYYKRNIIDIANKISQFTNTSISLKLTALGLAIDYDYCLENLSEIIDTNVRVHIDMEQSEFIDSTLNIFDYYRLNKNCNNLDITFQAYLYRTQKDIEERILKNEWKNKPLIRLCKGAYREPFDKIFPSKKLIDENYYNIAVKMLDNCDNIYPAFATHDHKLIEKIKNYVQYKGISKDNFEFQMLYGVRPSLQKKILEQGYNLRLYVPIGNDWYEYFVRRVAEKPSNILLILYSILKK